MRNIPVFTTDDGVASLILKEIPYKQTAFIRIQDVQPGGLEGLVRECAGFCRAAGAETVYAAGHPELSAYPLHTVIYCMSRTEAASGRDTPEGCLWPVTEQTAGNWRTIYNEKMASVDHAATLSSFDERELLRTGGAYFVHRDGVLWGIGWIRKGEVLALASCVPGRGRDVLETLLTAEPDQHVTLEVASTNQRAIRLYESMGFLKTGEKSRWYRVL